MVHPIIDEYYSYNPSHSRSSKYVQDKGLVTNEKGVLNGGSPGTTPGSLSTTSTKSTLSSSLRDSIATTLIPSMHSALPTIITARENDRADFRQLSSVQARDTWKPQDTQNTKKKRISLTSMDVSPSGTPIIEREPDSPPPRAAYGDPNKIAQYFPELNQGF
jgi:glutamine amidotransferase